MYAHGVAHSIDPWSGGVKQQMPFAMVSVSTRSASDGIWGVWAAQWENFDKSNRANVPVPTPVTVGGAAGAIANAIKKAGPGGTLVFNVGHGYHPTTRSGPSAMQPFEGGVDLAPNKKMLLVGTGSTERAAFVTVFL